MYFLSLLLEHLILMHIIDPNMRTLHFLQHLHQLVIGSRVSTSVILVELLEEETDRLVLIVATLETEFVVAFGAGWGTERVFAVLFDEHVFAMDIH